MKSESLSDRVMRLASQERKEPCSICGEPIEGFGNNAWPINEGRCCDRCNGMHVIPARILNL